MNKRRKFYTNTFMLYLMTAAKYVFPLITFPYLTRIFEPELYGVISYMTATVTYFQVFIDFGFNFSATKDITEHQDSKKYIGGVLGSVIKAKLLLLVCAIAIFTGMVYSIPIMRSNIILAYLYLGTVAISILLPDFMFRGIEKMEIITARFLLSKTVSTALIFIIVRTKSDILWIPILNIMGSLSAIILTWYQIKYKLHINVNFKKVKLYDAVNTIKKSMIYFLSTFATTAFSVTNTFLLGIMSLPTEDIAYWGVSYNLISSALALYGPIVNSLYPHMVAKKDFNLVKKILLIFMPLIILTVFIVNILADPIITIICGKEYFNSIPIFKSLLPILIFSFPAQMLGFPVLGVLGKEKQTTMTTVISAFFHICGLAILIITDSFTVFNVAILRSITEGVLLSSRWYFVNKEKRRYANHNL